MAKKKTTMCGDCLQKGGKGRRSVTKKEEEEECGNPSPNPPSENFGAPSLRRRLPWHDSKKAIFVPSLLHAFLAFSPSSDRAFRFFPRFILENEKSCAGKRQQAMFAGHCFFKLFCTWGLEHLCHIHTRIHGKLLL